MPKILILKNLNGLELAAIYGFNGLESTKYLNGLKKKMVGPDLGLSG